MRSLTARTALRGGVGGDARDQTSWPGELCWIEARLAGWDATGKGRCEAGDCDAAAPAGGAWPSEQGGAGLAQGGEDGVARRPG